MPEDQDPSAAAAAAVATELDVLDLDGPPAHVKGIFARHDLNGDGHLSRPEVSELITEFCELLHLEMTQAQRDQLLNEHFDAADKNRDSVLTLDEFRDFAALLDTAASALAGTGTAADAAAPDLLQKYAKLRREKKPRGDQEGSLLVDTQGRARMELFDRFDVNHDHKLDIEEAGTLLRSVLAEMGLSSGWVTTAWLKECLLTLTDKDGDTTTLTQDEYQRFCEKIGEWLPMLGAATESQEELPTAEAAKEVAAPSRLSSRYSDRPEEHKEPTTGDEELDDATFAQRYPEAHRASQAEAAEAEATAARSAAKGRAGGSSSACVLL